MKDKVLLFITFLMFFNEHYSQNYLSLDSLKANYKVNLYTLNTQKLYGFNKTIEMYNVFTTKNSLLLLSVLPNLENENNWEEIDYNVISGKILTIAKLENKLSSWLEYNVPENKTLEYKLLKKDGKKYYITNMCLFEFFKIATYSPPIISAYGTINIADNKVSIKEMEASFKKIVPKQTFPLDIRSGEWVKIVDNAYSVRNYLSKEYFIKNNKIYQFWTLDGWWTIDGYDEHRGIDRFAYIPGKGIVGGSYDFYFAHKPKLVYNHNAQLPVPTKIIWDNIINEKIMIAEELK